MYTLDRFARNRYDSAIYKAKLKKNGVRIYYAKQPMPDTPEGIILESVLEGYAEYYSENLARNIKRGIRENALQGLATGGANLLLGYTVGEDRKYAIDPTGAKIVQEIFQLYADGMSATQIIAYCNERGYKTARGNAFNKNSLRTILRNEKYIGTYKLMDIVIPDGMPSIIDKVLFEKVQAMLKHNGKARAKAKAHENYLLTTKLFCGHCGSPMVGESGTSKTGQVHYYYKCTKAKREHACKKKSERKDWIEKLVVRYTVQNVLTDENIALIAKRAMEIIEKESADTTYLDGLNAELKDVQKKIKNLVSAIEQGIITSATKDRLDELEQEKSDIEGRIAREEMKKPLLNENRIRYWLTSFKSGNVDDEDYQRRVIDTLVNSVYVYDDEDGGKRIVLTFNLSGNNTATLTSSDIECYAPPYQYNTTCSFCAYRAGGANGVVFFAHTYTKSMGANTSAMRKIFCLLKKELMLTISVLMAGLSLFLSKPGIETLRGIDWHTLAILFMMLTVLEGFKKENIFQPVLKLSEKITSMTGISFFLIFGVFFSSMFVTNDVSLIVFVPLTILLFRTAKKESYILPVISMENIAAVRGSLLTPFGSPQNLFLFEQSGVSVGKFMLHMLPLWISSALLLGGFIFFLYRKDPRERISLLGSAGEAWKPERKKYRSLYLGLFVLTVAAVVSRTPHWPAAAGIVLAAILLFDPSVLMKTDYVLLLTFLCFFVFSSQITANEAVFRFLTDAVAGHEYFWGIGLSQIISNVPASIVLYPFTNNLAALLYGVDTAGLCSIIGSLASVINYRLYVRSYPGKGGKFMKTFTLISWAFFLIVVVPGYFLSKHWLF